MTFLNIVLGLIGLGIIVFIHELGHFLAARLVGVDVEAFSIGWGNPILKKKIGSVEYRLGMFPLGGYCKMKGAADHNNEAWENIQNGIKPEKGTYLAASPQARILIAFAGPLFNLIFAVIILSFILGAGRDFFVIESRIVLASDLASDRIEEIFPADEAGFLSGDRITHINNRPVQFFHEIQEIISLNANRALAVTIDRNGEIISKTVTPALDRSTGAGRIGITIWEDPIIRTVTQQSPAEAAGLRPGDIIVSAGGETVRNGADFSRIRAQTAGNMVIVFERDGYQMNALFSAKELEGELGFTWDSFIRHSTPRLNPFAALARGFTESLRTLGTSVRSLRLLFMGIDLTNAVSGPVRITYMIGDVATQGFEHGFAAGLRATFGFIAMISIILCMMNLLPLPVVDGGMIILFFVELLRGKPIPPKAISIFQMCGMVLIGGLIVLAIFGDIMFFIRR
ncbi:MAG: site-2 protease family protein [Treponema sp.]|nr:site-2 protease family protein [Treponema sp.]